MRALIPLVAVLVAGPARAGSAGLGVGILSWQATDRHLAAPQVSAFYQHDLRDDVAARVEAAHSAQRFDGADHAFAHRQVRLAALARGRIGPDRAKAVVDLGPALTVRRTALRGGGHDHVAWQWQPGARVCAGIEGRLGEHLQLEWGLGATTRRASVDLDTRFGLGWAW